MAKDSSRRRPRTSSWSSACCLRGDRNPKSSSRIGFICGWCLFHDLPPELFDRAVDRRWWLHLFLPYPRGIFLTGLLVPPVETREVTRIPCLAESRSTQIPVWADFTRHGAQVAPKIGDRRTAPEPVAVIDAVDHETRFEHERMRDHRIVLGVGVLLNVEILLNRSTGVCKECPHGSDRRTELLERMVIVGRDRGDLSVRHRDLRVERGKFQMLLVLLWAIVAAREGEDQRVVAL